jgi:AcrR family transcriptional regulator
MVNFNVLKQVFQSTILYKLSVLRYNRKEVADMNKSNAEKDFITAFWKLYKNKKIEKISIRELCQLAGYNRTTFYAHFENIYDLLNKAIETLLNPSKVMIQKFNDFPAILGNDTVMQVFLLLFQTYDKYIELLLKNNNQYILEEKIKEIIIPLFKSKFPPDKFDKKLKYTIDYQISAVFATIMKWFLNNKDIPEKELIELIYEISSKGVFSVLNEAANSVDNEISENDKVLLDTILNTIKQI